MATLKNINFMTTNKFNSLSETSLDEIYLVEERVDPDYGAGIGVAASITYTIPADGVILVTVTHADHASNTLTINNISVYSTYMTGKYSNGALPPTSFIVKAGDVVLANRALTFYPFK